MCISQSGCKEENGRGTCVSNRIYTRTQKKKYYVKLLGLPPAGVCPPRLKCVIIGKKKKKRKEKEKYLYFCFVLFFSLFFLLLFTRRLWARLLSARTKWDGRTFAVVTFLSADDCSIVVILFFVFRCYVSSSPRNFLDSNSLVYFFKKKKTKTCLARNRVSFCLDLGFIRKI